MAITLAVVTCEMDLDLLSRFIDSVNTHFCHADLDKVIVVFNDPYYLMPEFETVMESIRNKVKENFQIETHWANALWPELTDYNWNSQQQLKLSVSKLVQTDWYVIHDSKDFYTEAIGLENFIKPNEECYCAMQFINNDPWLGRFGTFYNEYKTAYQLFDLDYNNYEMALRPEYDVCPVHTQTVVNMLDYLERNFGKLAIRLMELEFRGKQMVTEYALLSAWHHKTDLMLEKYSLPAVNQAQSYNNKVSRNKDLRRKNNKSLATKKEEL
jgi:hypothetical protein